MAGNPRTMCGQAPSPKTISYAVSANAPDKINLATFNIHIEVPLFVKPGRGADTDYVLMYDSNGGLGYSWSGPWVNSIYDYQWVYGWEDRLKMPPGAGMVYNSDTAILCNTSQPGPGDPSDPSASYATVYRDFGFEDRDGIYHPFDQFVVWDIGVCSYPVPGQTPDVASGLATDGSGYWMSAALDDLQSSLIVSPSGIDSYNGNGSLAIKPKGTCDGDVANVDTNGNQISWWWPIVPGNAACIPDGNTVVTDTTGAQFQVGDNPDGPGFTVIYTDSSGSQRTVKVNYEKVMIQTNYQLTYEIGQLGTPYDIGPYPMLIPRSVVYPDGSSYQFTYEPTPGYPGNITGRISSITLPTGGVISYQYGGPHNGIDVQQCQSNSEVYDCVIDGGPDILTRTTADGSTTYSRTVAPVGSISPGSPVRTWHVTSTITNPDLSHSQTVIDNIYGAGGQYFETRKQIFEGTAGSTPVLETMHCYNGATGDCTNQVLHYPPIITSDRLTTTVNGTQSAVTVTQNNSIGLPIEIDAYDHGMSSPTRKTVINYASLPLAEYKNISGGPNITDKPHDVTIYEGSGNMLSKTTYGYDSDATFSHGNLADIYRQIDASGSSIHESNAYDSHGMLTSSRDMKGNITTYTYDGTGSFLQSSDITNPDGSEVNGVSHKIEYSFDPNTGLLKSSTDPNKETTSYQYDSLGRLTDKVLPDGGETRYCYHLYGQDAPPDCANSAANSVTTITSQSSGVSQVQELDMDGLGRQVNLIAPNGASSETTYDAMGRVQSQANPHLSSGSGSGGVTSYVYDVLGRKRFQCQPDNASNNIPCIPNKSYLEWDYSGNVIDFYDEMRHHWQRSYDALGWLTHVIEDPSLLNYRTDYSYDGLGNLIHITQGGVKDRVFNYDFLSRLTSSSNPESGATTYFYVDSHGAACSGDPSLPCMKTDARNRSVVYSYDGLNRITGKQYFLDAGATILDSNTSSACFQYDSSTFGDDKSYFVGRLTNEWTQYGSCSSTLPSNGVETRRSILAYDPVGRIKKEQQCSLSKCTGGNSYSVAYDYDLFGHLTRSTNGIDSIYVTNEYNSAGYLTSITSSWDDPQHGYPTSLFSNGAYTASGSLADAMFGPGLSLHHSYNSRLWLTDTQIKGTVVHPAVSGAATVDLTGAVQSK